MAASTRVLQMMDMSISGAFSTQFMMTTVSGRKLLPQLSEQSVSDWFAIPLRKLLYV